MTLELDGYSTLDLTLEQAWLTVWFNEPERKNPLTTKRMSELRALAADLGDNRDIRGVIFRGCGGVFCSGGDLAAFKVAFEQGDVRNDVIKLSSEAAVVFDVVDTLPQYTVMVVEGAALAGGMGLACCGDYVLAHTDAKFALTETRLGIVAAQIAPFVLRKVGYANARHLMLRAATLNGHEAKSIGLANAVFKNEAELTVALEGIRTDVLRTAPNALAVTKKLLAEIEDLTRPDQIARAASDFTDCLLSDEGREGVASFLQKRKPAWAEKPDV